MQPSWKFYLSGIILTLHKIRKYMPTFEGTPRPTDPKISFIRKSAHQLIGKWCQRNYRSHLRPQGKTPFLQPRAVPLYLPDRCQNDKQPHTQTWVWTHTWAHKTPQEEPTEDSRLSAQQSKERLERKLRVKWGSGETERKEHMRLIERVDPASNCTWCKMPVPPHSCPWNWQDRSASPQPGVGGVSKVPGSLTLRGHFSRTEAAEGRGCRGSASQHLQSGFAERTNLNNILFMRWRKRQGRLKWQF